MRNEKLVTEDGASSVTQRKGDSAFDAATKQRLVKTVKTLCVL
jgi:hypothetical protein